MFLKKLLLLALLLHLGLPYSCNADIRTRRIERTAQDLVLLYWGALALYLVSNLPVTLCHELGHKYAAKALTGADSTIEVGLFGGATKFNQENWQLVNKYPKRKIMGLLAGPLAGCLGACGIYFWGSRYFEKYSPLYAMALSALMGALVGELSNLWPAEDNNGAQSDGAQIMATLKQMKEEKGETKSPLVKLAEALPADKRGLIKTITDGKSALHESKPAVALAA